jgi:hypothetical protein
MGRNKGRNIVLPLRCSFDHRSHGPGHDPAGIGVQQGGSQIMVKASAFCCWGGVAGGLKLP